MSGEIAPIIEILMGPCNSLTCQEISILQAANDRLFENEVGVKYFFYVYTMFALGGTPYLLSVEEIKPKYGVWFKYQKTSPPQEVVLRATDNLGFVMYGGVQVANGDQFNCIDYTIVDTLLDTFDDIEWIAETGIMYLILIASPSPYYSGAFELTLQSRGDLLAPATASIPGPPVAAPAASDQASQVPTVSTIRLPSDSPSSSGDAAGAIFKSSLSLAILAGLASFFCFWF